MFCQSMVLNARSCEGCDEGSISGAVKEAIWVYPGGTWILPLLLGGGPF